MNVIGQLNGNEGKTLALKPDGLAYATEEGKVYSLVMGHSGDLTSWCSNGVMDLATSEDGVDCGGWCPTACPAAPRPVFTSKLGRSSRAIAYVHSAIGNPRIVMTVTFTSAVSGLEPSDVVASAKPYVDEEGNMHGVGAVVDVTAVVPVGGSEPATAWHVTLVPQHLSGTYGIVVSLPAGKTVPSNSAADSFFLGLSVIHYPSASFFADCDAMKMSGYCHPTGTLGCDPKEHESRCLCNYGYTGPRCDTRVCKSGGQLARFGSRVMCARLRETDYSCDTSERVFLPQTQAELTDLFAFCDATTTDGCALGIEPRQGNTYMLPCHSAWSTPRLWMLSIHCCPIY